MDIQPFGGMAMELPQVQVMPVSNQGDSMSARLKTEGEDHQSDSQTVQSSSCQEGREPQNEDYNMEEGEEEEDSEEDKEEQDGETRKKPRRSRAKVKRKGRARRNLVLADAQTAAAFTFMRKRRQDLTLGAKVKVLELLEQEPKVPQGKIASMFRVSQSQVSRIMKNKEAIMAQWNRFATPDRKRCRLGKAGALEQKLVDWYKEAKKEDLPISGPILMEKAKSIGNEMGIDFKPSAGWLGRWKDRNGVTLKRFKDKDGAPSATKVGNHWRRYMFTKATKDYSLENVWVVDETVLTYDALPEHMAHGAVNGSDKFSVILACNLAGTERKTPVIVGRSHTLGSLALPTQFHENPDSAVTLEFFSSWLKDWDRELQTKRKKIVLLLSKVQHHPENPHIFNINVTFFPPDTSAVLQPLHLGIINVFKSLYRYQQLKYIMARTHASEKIGLCNMFNHNVLSPPSLSLSPLDAVFMVSKAWRHVSPETIVKGVVKAGLSKDVDALNVIDQVRAPPGLSQEDFETFVNSDEGFGINEHAGQLPPQALNTHAGILGNIHYAHYPSIYPGNKPQQPNPHSEPSGESMYGYPNVSEAIYACQILRRYLQKRGGQLYDEFSELESAIHLDMILETRPELQNDFQPDPLHDPSSVHSLEAHQVALEQKIDYLQKIQDELNQQKVQKELKKVNPPAAHQNPNNLTTPPQETRNDLHAQLLGMQRSAMPSHELPRQDMLRQDLHHPMQHPDHMRQDIMRAEYRPEIQHQDRPRTSLLEPRSFRQSHTNVRNELCSDGKSDALSVPADLRNLTSDHRPGAELHHQGMEVTHSIRQPDARLENPGIPYYTITNPLPHYMQSK